MCTSSEYIHWKYFIYLFLDAEYGEIDFSSGWIASIQHAWCTLYVRLSISEPRKMRPHLNLLKHQYTSDTMLFYMRRLGFEILMCVS